MKLEAGRETGQGAGALFYAQDTGRLLFVKRSEYCDHPNVWCGLGGGIENGETHEEAIRREVWEEAGYQSNDPLIHMHSDQQGSFVFHNYWAITPHEFEPVLNDEHNDYCWSNELVEPLHPGLERSIAEFEKRIKQNGSD
jgi:8-oxo-dGTP pyrophosphatase MutT (NUDIX family)